MIRLFLIFAAVGLVCSCSNSVITTPPDPAPIGDTITISKTDYDKLISNANALNITLKNPQ